MYWRTRIKKKNKEGIAEGDREEGERGGEDSAKALSLLAPIRYPEVRNKSCTFLACWRH